MSSAGWRSWFTSIQNRLVIVSTASFAVAMLTLAVYWYQHIGAEQVRTEIYFASIAKTLTLATKEAVITTNLPLIEAYVNQIHGSNEAIAQTTILNEEGSVMFSHHARAVSPQVDRQLRTIVMSSLAAKSTNEQRIPALGGAYLIVVEPIQIAGESWGTVAVTFSMENVLRERNRLFFGMSSVVVFFVVVFVVSVMYVRRILLTPILNIVAVTHEVSQGDLTARAEVKGEDELGQLALSFNQMVEELDKRISVLLALHEVSSSLVAPLDLSERLETVARAIVGLVGAACGMMLLPNDTHDMLEVVSSLEVHPGPADESLGAPQQISEGPSGLAYTDHIIVAGGVVSTPKGVTRWEDAEMGGYHGLMAVPLEISHDAIGVINLYFDSPTSFGAEELVVLRDAANQAAVIVENARLYEGLQQNLQKLERSYEQLSELDKMKSDFIAITSHELRTPLTAVKSYVQLLQDGRFGEITEEQRLRLGYVEKHADHLARLLDDLVDLARIDRKEFEVDAQPLHLGRLAREVVSELAPLVEEKELKLTLKIPGKLPRVLAEKRRLVQVMNNLIGNAIKFTPREGEIKVTAREGDDGSVELAVTDTGPGIPEEDLERIFEPFVQVESVLTREHPGVGLGLAVCRGIIEAHGGTVVATSPEGEGTTIICTLPPASG